jgi:putative ABC transport system permease protein
VSVLQGTPGIRSARSKLRKSLVVFQFTVATVFVFSTTGLIRQVNYLSTVDLGFDTENILLLDFDGERAADDLQLVKNDLTSLATVVSATASNCPPGRASYWYRAYYTHEDRREEDRVVTKYYEVDNDFLSTFGLEITRGRRFSKDIPSEAGNAIIISESGVKALEADNPIGAYLYRGDDSFYEVVGVVKDFHGTTLDFGFKSISVIRLKPDECTSLAVKLAPGNLRGSIGAVRQVWESYVPGVAFKYTFLDDEIDSNYNSLRQEGSMFLWLAVFAIGIACLGIFGLVSYTAERRTKEIGIRKVMGASVSRIVAMLVKEFVLLIVIANAIGLPVAYLLVNDFLSWYPFRVSIGIGSYAFVLAVAVCFAMFTAGFQSVKAGLANPVDSLRRE